MPVPRILSIFVVVIITIISAGVLFLYFNRNALIKETIVELGSDILKTDVTVGNVNLDILQYTITIDDFSIANPANFPDGEAIGFQHVTISLPVNISLDPIHIQTIQIVEPRIHLSQDKDNSNLLELTRNAQAYIPESDDDTTDSEVLIKIDEIAVNNPVFKVSSHLIPDQTLTIDAPSIYLENIGSPDGIPPNELADVILSQLSEKAFAAFSQQTDKLLDAATKVIENLSNQTSDVVEDASKTVDNLLKDAEKLFQ